MIDLSLLCVQDVSNHGPMLQGGLGITMGLSMGEDGNRLSKDPDGRLITLNPRF